MAISLADLRTELRVHIGLESGDTTGLPDTDADLLLNRAFWELMNKFNFRDEECSIEFTVDQAEDFISLPTLFESLRKLSVLDSVSNQWTPIDRIGVDLAEKLSNDDTDNQGVPVKYFREGVGIRLLSSSGGGPDKTYTLRIKYRITLADLGDANTTLVIPDVWHELLLYGGIWRAFHRKKDYITAREMRKFQVSLISSTVPVEAKEEGDSSMAGVDLPSELTEI